MAGKNSVSHAITENTTIQAASRCIVMVRENKGSYVKQYACNFIIVQYKCNSNRYYHRHFISNSYNGNA